MIEEGVTVCPYAVSVIEKYLEKCSYKSLNSVKSQNSYTNGPHRHIFYLGLFNS